MNSIAMRAKRISIEQVCIGIIVVAVAKDSAMHAQWIKCRCRREDGLTRFECAMPARIFYRRSVTLVQVCPEWTIEMMEQVNYTDSSPSQLAIYNTYSPDYAITLYMFIDCKVYLCRSIGQLILTFSQLYMTSKHFFFPFSSMYVYVHAVRVCHTDCVVWIHPANIQTKPIKQTQRCYSNNSKFICRQYDRRSRRSCSKIWRSCFQHTDLGRIGIRISERLATIRSISAFY